MEIYKIKNLDCSKKENRKLLAKEAMKIAKIEEKPTKEKLESICYKISKKYGYKVNTASINNGKLQISIEVDRGTYSVMLCDTYYEALLKFVVFAKAYYEYEKLVNK